MVSSYFSGTSNPQYSEFIHLSRYSRWLDSHGRRESWEETVARYISFFEKKHPEQAAVLKEAQEHILKLDVMPSMRCLMTAGPALDRDHVAGYNCLGGETLVTTKEYGIVPISSLVNKEVHVVDGNGDWVLAKCKSYGTQDLYNVQFTTSGKGTFVVRATKNHRWIRKNNTECLTADLRPGESLATTSMPARPLVDTTSEDYRAGVVHGLVYGDGTSLLKQSSGTAPKLMTKTSLCKGFAIRICSDADDLLPFFGDSPVSYPATFGGDPVVYLFNSGLDLKSLPEVSTNFFTDEYLLGFLRGWLAADGSVSKSGQVSLAATTVGVSWLNQVGPRFGFVSRGEREYPAETNLGLRSQPLYCVNFDRRWLTSDDQLIARKRARFKQLPPGGQAKVQNVSYSAREEVFCFDVPTTHSFLLTRNLLTGNCSYVAVDHPRVFDEIMYVLMCGTGVGFSVERQYINQLPEVAETFHPTDTTIIVSDSKIGWASAYRELVSMLYAGKIPQTDFSRVRPAGARLKTFGGRASGPKPLMDLFAFTTACFTKAAGRKLTSLECHDLVCKIAEIVVVGGVRRSALISLSNVSDDRMRSAKSGQWWMDHKQRSLANNSAAYTERPSFEVFLAEIQSLYASKSGERGIFSRVASKKQAALTGRRDPNHDFGTNPCSEIILRSAQFCNLTEVVIRSTDSLDDLLKKVYFATFLGTLQSSLTDFRYLRKIWRKNTEDERLLGVSLTGIMDHPVLGDPDHPELDHWLTTMRAHAVQTNAMFATQMGIQPSAAITCVKPSGTVSQLVDSSSGIHPRFAPYYVRTVRADRKDPLAQLMSDLNFPCEPDVMNSENLVFSFPIKAPETSRFVKDVKALDQLRLWSAYQKYWCEHKPSATIYYTDDEFLAVAQYVWTHFDSMSGVSFLPVNDHVYQQAPYQPIDKETYEALVAKMPQDVDWSTLVLYEQTDSTKNQQTFACSADGSCETVDLA